MSFGIKDIDSVPENEWIVFCNNCESHFYEEIGDERNTNSLEFIKDGNEFYKGCPICKTDSYLSNRGFRKDGKFILNDDKMREG